MRKNIVLYTLQTFSTTGGIQKMTRTLAHALDTLSQSRQWWFKLKSLYDANTDLMPQYLPARKFEGFDLSRIRFVLNAALTARQSSVIIVSHINLALIGLITKALNPKCRVWLIAHGIEVWRPLSVVQRRLLKRCDKVICVSSFTKEKLIAMHGTKADKCEVLNNAVDPFMKLPASFTKPEYLLKRYHIDEEMPVIFTLTRMASSEQYKGHDHVIEILGRLREKFPDIRYVLAGSYDHKEEIRIQKLIAEAKVDKEVILTGFIEEAELTDYFLLADLFVLPSKKEGFGIVFIEALACGLPVVCGNADGSIDAIRNGDLGTAVNVDDLCELEQAITAYLSSAIKKQKRKKLQSACLQYFNEDNYMNKLEKMLLNE